MAPRDCSRTSPSCTCARQRQPSNLISKPQPARENGRGVSESSIGCSSARSGAGERAGRRCGTLVAARGRGLGGRARGAPRGFAPAGPQLGEDLSLSHFFRRNSRTFSAELPTAFTAARISASVQPSDLVSRGLRTPRLARSLAVLPGPALFIAHFAPFAGTGVLPVGAAGFLSSPLLFGSCPPSSRLVFGWFFAMGCSRMGIQVSFPARHPPLK